MSGAAQGTTVDLRRITAPWTPTHDQVTSVALGALARYSAYRQETHRHRQLGCHDDRAAAAQWLASRLGPGLEPDSCLIANGTQAALALLIEHLVPRGGVLLVEELSYTQARQIAISLGRRVEPVAIDEQGLRPDALADMCMRHAARALYCVPTAQNPTASTMPLERRQDIADLARRHALMIIEDDAQGLIPAHAPSPLRMLAAERSWYVMGLSKCLALGLRLAFICTPSPADAQLLTEQALAATLLHCNPFSTALATQLIRSGGAVELLDAVRAEARSRWQIAVERLNLANAFDRSGPQLHVWLGLPDPAREREAAHALRASRILVRSGAEFRTTADCTSFGLRVSLSDAPLSQLATALSCIRDSLGGLRHG